MKRVIYHTEYFDNNGQFLREEEQDAYFNTLPQDSSQLEIEPPIGCRLLQPKLVPSKLTQEQWEYLKAKKPDSELKYASLCEDANGGYSIYAIYEQWLGYEKDGEISSVYPVVISFGDKEEVMLEMHVIPMDYIAGEEHITRWDEALFEGTDISRTENYIKIISSPYPAQDKQVIIHHNSWTISGKWESMEEASPVMITYLCHNSLFPFKITINIEKEADVYHEAYKNYLE